MLKAKLSEKQGDFYKVSYGYTKEVCSLDTFDPSLPQIQTQTDSFIVQTTKSPVALMAAVVEHLKKNANVAAEAITELSISPQRPIHVVEL